MTVRAIWAVPCRIDVATAQPPIGSRQKSGAASQGSQAASPEERVRGAETVESRRCMGNSADRDQAVEYRSSGGGGKASARP